MHQVMNGLFSVDRGIPFTLKQLFTRPGHAVREYLAGRRKPYFPPVTLLMILSALGVIIATQMNIDMNPFADLNVRGSEHMHAIMSWLIENQAWLYLGMVPITAFSAWLFMRPFGHGFVEHMLINIFISVQLAVLSLVSYLFMAIPALFIAAVALSNTAYIGFFTWTYAQLYAAHSPTQVSVRLLCTFGLLCFFVLIVMVLGVLYVAMLAARDSGRL